MTNRRSQEKQLTNARVRLHVGEQEHSAECNIFIESYGPPPRWHGRLWAMTPPATLKRGERATLTLPRGSTAEISISKPAMRGAYEFHGEGMPPDF